MCLLTLQTEMFRSTSFEVPKTIAKKRNFVWGLAPCNLVELQWHFQGNLLPTKSVHTMPVQPVICYEQHRQYLVSLRAT